MMDGDGFFGEDDDDDTLGGTVDEKMPSILKLGQWRRRDRQVDNIGLDEEGCGSRREFGMSVQDANY